MPNQYPEIYTQFFANIFIAFILVSLIVSLLFLYQKKRAIKEKEIETIKISFEKALLQTQIEIQEEVLKNISMELHDNIGQIMLLANINATMLQKMDLPENALNVVFDTKKCISKAMEDISELSASLNSDRIVEIGIIKAITQELNQLSKKDLFEIIITNTLKEDDLKLPAAIQLMVFRMFQEIIKNIIKHANAKNIEFIILQNENFIELKFIDDGIGFNYSASSQQEFNGIGLRSLHSRAKHFNGDVQIKSVLQKGTTISIFIPVSPDC